MTKKKKIFVLSGMVALLVITGVLNIVLNQPTSTPPPAGGDVVSGYNFFTVRNRHIAQRNEALIAWTAVVQAGGENAAQAQEQLTAIGNAMVLESKLETLIGALGYDEVLVTAADPVVTVLLRSEVLNDIQVAQIVQTITSNTNRTASDIKIMEIP
ncbi:MAG: SpoIIIAH-like family protein [Firmicutes bacterium]|nr:SpoIIIAH-like family protein [Bacillota bacterium]